MPLRSLVSLLAPPLCWGCGAPCHRSDPLCRHCRQTLRWLGPQPVLLAGVPTWAPVAYEGPARALVRGLKFRAAAGLAEPLAAQMAAGAPSEWLAEAQLVPVPLHRTRKRKRGFNQAERLAASLARRTKSPLSDCLERAGPQAPQAGQGRAERLAAPPGTIILRAGHRPPEQALLVDDVATTGATLAACANALKVGGSQTVHALAYARTLAR